MEKTMSAQVVDNVSVKQVAIFGLLQEAVKKESPML